MSDLRFLETYSKMFLLFLKSILIIFQFQSERIICWVLLNRPLSWPSDFEILDRLLSYFEFSGPSTFDMRDLPLQLITTTAQNFGSQDHPVWLKTVQFRATVHFDDRPLSPLWTVHFRPDSKSGFGFDGLVL